MTIKPTVEHIAKWMPSAMAPSGMMALCASGLSLSNISVGRLNTFVGRLGQEGMLGHEATLDRRHRH